MRIPIGYTGTVAAVAFMMAIPSAALAQGTSESTAIEFEVARSVALKAEPRFDSKTIRVLEAGTVLRGYLLSGGDWWRASYDPVIGFLRDSAVDTTGRRGRAVVTARREVARRQAVTTRVTLRDSLRALVSERRARRELVEYVFAAHAEGVRDLSRRGIDISLLTARFLPKRRLSGLEKEMMRIEEAEWERHCDAAGLEDCPALPGPAWGYLVGLENLYDSRIDSVWFEVVAVTPDGAVQGSYVFQGIGPVGGGVPGGQWLFEPEVFPRGTVCAELVEMEVSWEDGLLQSYSGDALRLARLPIHARGWPVLEVGPVGARFGERSRRAFEIDEIVLEGDCRGR